MPLYTPPAAGGGGSTPIRGDFKPQHRGWKGAAYDPDLVSVSAFASAAAAGYLHMVKVYVEDTAAIANLLVGVSGGGSGLTAGQCKGFVYSSAGTLIAQTASLDSALTTAGFKSLALTAESGQSLALGGEDIWIHCGLLVNGSGMPTLLGISGSAAQGAAHWGLSAPAWRFCHQGAGNTSVPSTRPSLTEDMGRQWWMGVS